MDLRQHTYAESSEDVIHGRDLYPLIAEGAPIVLDGKEVEGFSLCDFREEHGLPEDAPIVLNNFSARDTHFHCKGTLDLSFAVFQGARADFTGSHFKAERLRMDNCRFLTEEVLFQKAQFLTKEVDFQFSDFGNATLSFKEGYSLRSNFLFTSAVFGDGVVTFKGFEKNYGRLSFHFARMGDLDLSFEAADMGDGDFDFRKVEMGRGKKDFRRIRFGKGNVSFDECAFGAGRINFNKAQFGNGKTSFDLLHAPGQDLTMDRAEFDSGSFSAQGAVIGKISMRSCHLDVYTDLRVEHCSLIDLSNTIVRDLVDLRAGTHNVSIKQLVIIGMRDVGRILIDWQLNHVDKLIRNQHKATFKEKADQYLILKENFHEAGQYRDEDLAYVAYKRMERKADLQGQLTRNKWNAIWAIPSSGFQWLVFDKMGHFATNPIRVLLSMLVVFSSFSLVYAGLEWMGHSEIICAGNAEHMGTLARSFYYSAITFLTIGYGDCLPTGHGHWLAPIEGWAGMFMLSYFTVAFVRKILR